MAWTYEQKFDGLNNGDLAGQDSWSLKYGTGPHYVDDTVVSQGTKALRRVGGIGDAVVYERTIIAITDGIVYIDMRYHKVGTVQVGFYLLDGSTEIMNALLDQGGTNKIKLRANNIYHEIADAAADTWFRIGLEIDAANNRCRINIDGGAWSDWYATVAYTKIDTMWIISTDVTSESDEAYWDYISPNYAEPAKPRSQGFIF